MRAAGATGEGPLDTAKDVLVLKRESEQAGGWFTMIEEHLKLPLEIEILGAPASVVRIDTWRNMVRQVPAGRKYTLPAGMDQTEHIVAVCRRGKYRQSIPILDIPLPSPPPAGAEWIEAYRRWRG